VSWQLLHLAPGPALALSLGEPIGLAAPPRKHAIKPLLRTSRGDNRGRWPLDARFNAEHLTTRESPPPPERGGPGADSSIEKILQMFVVAVGDWCALIKEHARRWVRSKIEWRISAAQRDKPLHQFVEVRGAGGPD
jgi:hypothetical protein